MGEHVTNIGGFFKRPYPRETAAHRRMRIAVEKTVRMIRSLW